jgi:hypothetical protein
VRAKEREGELTSEDQTGAVQLAAVRSLHGKSVQTATVHSRWIREREAPRVFGRSVKRQEVRVVVARTHAFDIAVERKAQR